MNQKENEKNKIQNKDKIYKIKKNRDIIDSFNNAIDGIINAINTERNMKTHMIMAILIMGISILLDFTRVELILIAITIILVLASELFNTAIETLTDLASKGEYSKLAKRTKDISAGAVFISAVNAVFIAYLLLYPKIKTIFHEGSILKRIMINPEHLTIISIAIVVLLTILLKGIFYKLNTTHLKGGAVSGHSSIAFNLATIGSILGNNYIITILFFLIALLVAQSRVESKTHTISEVLLGAVLGVIIAIVVFFKFI